MANYKSELIDGLRAAVRKHRLAKEVFPELYERDVKEKKSLEFGA